MIFIKPFFRRALPVSFSLFGTLLTVGCLLDDKTDKGNGSVGPGKEIEVSRCGDVPDAQRAVADSLVALAAQRQSTDMEYIFGEADEWDQVQSRDLKSVVSLYEQALAVAPSHCGAHFGLAVAKTMATLQDDELDAFVQKTMAQEDAPLAKGTRSLFKMSPDQSPRALMKLNGSLETVDPVTVTEVQDLIAKVILPRVDSTIAGFETVMGDSAFFFDFEVENRTVRIDLGQIGPGLAGLKLLKAWLTVAVGYQWEMAKNGNYDWIDSLQLLELDEFDNLSAGKRAALDHVTGLFSEESSFSRMKPQWKPAIGAIPALLLEAMDDAEAGIRAMLAQADNLEAQRHHMIRVGEGVDYDVSSAELLDFIDLLERGRKYLEGEVPVTYYKGTRTLHVDFPKLFQVDGFQSFLPHFAFYPYEEWNDTVYADTSWNVLSTANAYAPHTIAHSESFRLLSRVLGYPDHDWDLNWAVEDSGVLILMPYGYFVQSAEVIGRLTLDAADPCQGTFQRYFDRTPIPQQNFGHHFESVPHEETVSVRIPGCRLDLDGVHYISYIDADTKGPIYFTDESGKKTVDIQDLIELDIENPTDLQGLIYFRDPTFGGLFPKLTNQDLWLTVQLVSKIRTPYRQCEYVSDAQGSYREKCEWVNMDKASDLDVMIRMLWVLAEIMDSASEEVVEAAF